LRFLRCSATEWGDGMISKFISNEMRGIKTLLDWGDDGFIPVAQEEAQARGDICTGRLSGNPCPHNQRRDIDFNSIVGKIVKAHIERKNGMNLSIENEPGLGVCMVCRCHLPLKIHTPMDTLLGCMDSETLSKFPAFCWMKQQTQTPAP